MTIPNISSLVPGTYEMKLLVFDWTLRKIIEISAGPLIEALTWFHFSSATPKWGKDFWLFCKLSLKPNHLRLLKINIVWVVSSMSNVIKSFRVCAWLWRGYAIAHGGSLCWAFLHSPFVALVRWHLGSQFARRNSFGCSCCRAGFAAPSTWATAASQKRAREAGGNRDLARGAMSNFFFWKSHASLLHFTCRTTETPTSKKPLKSRRKGSRPKRGRNLQTDPKPCRFQNRILDDSHIAASAPF